MEEILLMGEKYWLTIGLAILAVLIFLIYGFNNSTEFIQKFLIPKFSLP